MSGDVTRHEAAEILGYTYRSLTTLMNRHPDRWPQSVGKRKVGRVWQLTYDLEALKAAAGISKITDKPLTKAASLSDADGLITCLYCGRRFRALARHLSAAHDTTAAEYRAEHNLPATGATVADITRVRTRETVRASLAADPTMLDHLKPYQTSDRARELGKRAADSVRASQQIPLAQEHRLPGRQYAVARMVEQRLKKLDEAARAHGYADADDAVAATSHLSAKAAARVTGLSAQTITRRRTQPAQ